MAYPSRKEGKSNELATKRPMQIITEDTIFDEGLYGELITKSWKESLEDDSHFEDVCD